MMRFGERCLLRATALAVGCAVAFASVACVAAIRCLPLVPIPQTSTRDAAILAQIGVGAFVCTLPIVVFLIGYGRVRKAHGGEA